MADFAALDAVHQAQPTNFDSLDQRMLYQSDAQRIERSADEKLFVKFYVKTVKDEEKSIEANRAIFEEKVYINIKMPGDKHNDVNRVAYPEDIMRFPAHYERFRKGQEQVTGTPLSAVPFLTEAQVEEYKAVFVRTAEQLAGLPDNICQRMMGSITHKQQAQAWLDSLKGADAVRAEFESKFAEMQAKIDALMVKTANPPLAAVPPVKK